MIALLAGSQRAVHCDAAGVLWSLADSAANQRLTRARAASRTSSASSSWATRAQRTAAGALHSLARLTENRVAIADAGGVRAWFGCSRPGWSTPLQAAGALAALVQGNGANQTAVANELVAKLSEGQIARERQGGG